MPSDDWKKDRDRQHQRTARREIAEFGYLRTYESLDDGAFQLSNEPDAFVGLLNELREKLPHQFKVQIPEFTTRSTDDNRNLILLIIRILQSGVDVNFTFLAVIVEQIGPPAIEELRRLISAAKYAIIIRALKVLQQVDRSLASVAETEIRDAAAFLQPDVQREGRGTLQHIGIYFRVRAQPEKLLGRWQRDEVVEDVEFTSDGILIRNNRFVGEFRCTDEGDIQVSHNNRIVEEWSVGETSVNRLALIAIDGTVAMYNRVKELDGLTTKKRSCRKVLKKKKR